VLSHHSLPGCCCDAGAGADDGPSAGGCWAGLRRGFTGALPLAAVAAGSSARRGRLLVALLGVARVRAGLLGWCARALLKSTAGIDDSTIGPSVEAPDRFDGADVVSCCGNRKVGALTSGCSLPVGWNKLGSSRSASKVCRSEAGRGRADEARHTAAARCESEGYKHGGRLGVVQCLEEGRFTRKASAEPHGAGLQLEAPPASTAVRIQAELYAKPLTAGWRGLRGLHYSKCDADEMCTAWLETSGVHARVYSMRRPLLHPCVVFTHASNGCRARVCFCVLPT
jgi:hypothetical protein